MIQNINDIKYHLSRRKMMTELKQAPYWLRLWLVTILILAAMLLVACNAPAPAQPQPTTAPQAAAVSHDDEDAADAYDADDRDDDVALSLPALTAVNLAAGERLRVVATTSIVGDVVSQVAGDAVELTTLMAAGLDPHGFSPSATQLTAVAGAHVIFINGWDLEEGLVGDLENISEGRVPLVPVSAGVEPLMLEEEDDDHVDDEDDHDHGPIDPHTWFDVANVIRWTENIVHVLSELDPANTVLYSANGGAYIHELEALDAFVREQTATVPAAKRKLVTNHDTMGYFARAYDFRVLETLIPGASTLAEPSARDLANVVDTLRQESICVIFVETIASDRLAQVVSSELDTCPEVQILSLYTDALGAPGSGADSYIGLMRFTVDTIVGALGE
jgi:ABC-type Zn uptake system ZnuABC Zn-binding protein ZnuA